MNKNKMGILLSHNSVKKSRNFDQQASFFNFLAKNEVF